MKPVEINRRAYGLGAQAARDGETLNDCPYTRLEFRTSWKHGFQSVANLANSPEGDGGAASVTPPEAASPSIDPYERHRQDVLRYRKRRLHGEPFTLWDFQVFAEINSNDLTKDYQEERDGDFYR